LSNTNSKSLRSLHALEEGCGILCGTAVRNDSLIVIMNSITFVIDFASIPELKSTRRLLAKYVGKRIAVIRLEDSATPPRVRIITPQDQDPKVNHE